jgi:hypothetical protein
VINFSKANGLAEANLSFHEPCGHVNVVVRNLNSVD